MTPERHAQIRELFLAACEQALEQRQTFLDKACGEDQQLRHEIERLLAHHSTMPTAEASAPQNKEKRSSEVVVRISDHQAQVIGPGQPGAFQSGQIIAERYRIVSLIGEGGMGSVYRADDLTLHQTVALKFLPAQRAGDPAWLRRFRQEVRLARDVTHPNVCRVYDIGEAGGVPFISMEYVDGEDLASLLRRIGRVPTAKGVEIAGQLCAGLAAAHIRGVLHRDLKPANVMIDGCGRVRITDFGLAGIVGQIEGREIRCGTPRYMAPEQLAGLAVSERSDIYSLGLVLYELFTGKPAFTADSILEYLRVHESAEPPAPSSLVPGIDPEVERVILACLRKDPTSRPESALLVAASLPGANLLAAALAVGETPSPEIVAAAAEGQRMQRRVLLGAFAAFSVLFGLHFVLAGKVHPVAPSAVPKSPAVLVDRAQDILAAAGYAREATARAYSLTEGLAPEFLFEHTPPESLRLGLSTFPSRGLVFWYRQSDTALRPTDVYNVLFSNARVTASDPPSNRPGMASTVLDPSGRLLLLEGNPRFEPERSTRSSFPDWAALFRYAGLDENAFTAAPPMLLPKCYASERRAWTGLPSDDQHSGLRVEAAAASDSVVLFAVLAQAGPRDPSIAAYDDLRQRAMHIMKSLALVVVTVVAVPCAWRNIRKGRSDRRGALAVGLFMVATRLLIWLLTAGRVPRSLGEIELLAYGLLGALVEGGLTWLFYLALEPYVRRYWPQTLLAWSTILRGRLRDPLVAGNVVMGGLVGVFWAVLLALDRLIPVWCGWATRSDIRLAGDFSYLLGARMALGWSLDLLRNATYQGLFYLLLIVLVRVLLRRNWLAALAATIIIALMYVPAGAHPLTAWVLVGGGGIAVAVWATVRFGLVTIIAAMFVCSLLNQFPVIPASSHWYSEVAQFSRFVPAALVVFALLESLRRKPAATASLS